MLCGCPEIEAHREAHALLDDCPLEENALPVSGDLAGKDPVRDQFHLAEIAFFVVVAETGNFREDPLANIVD